MPIYESDVCEECAPQPEDRVFQNIDEWSDRIGLRRRALRSVVVDNFAVQTVRFHTEQVFFAPNSVSDVPHWNQSPRPAHESPRMEESESGPLLAEQNTLEGEENFSGASASPDAD
jgi:hypothetical protein